MRFAATWAAFCTLLALTAFAAPVRADAPADAEPHGTFMTDAARPVVSGGARQGALDASPAWRQFRTRHGAWLASWNERTGTPHRAFGPAFALPGAADDAASIDGAVRGFVAGNPALFGAPTLETVAVEKAGRTWYARYRRTLNGVPVLFEDWEFRVSDRGRLEMFGADAHAAPRAGAPDARARIVRTLARQAAVRGLDGAATATVSDGGTWYLPLTTAAGTELRLVYEQEVAIQDPPHRWWTLVDASTGEVLWRQDRVRYAIAGKVTGLVHPVLPSDALAPVALPNLRVFVGGNTVVTDSLGNYTSPASGTVTVADSLIGLYCDVNDDLPPPGRIATTASDPSTLNLAWDTSNANDAERDAYYHVNVVHAFIKRVDPTMTGLDHPVPTRVNVNATCNAYWDGTGVNFYRAGGGCVNTGTMANVIYHEYGHGINDFTYLQHGSPNGMQNGALHEGMADVNAAFLMDHSTIGEGFYGPGTSLRELANTRRWPQDASGDPHMTGLIIGGAWWDLRQSLGLPLALHLEHFAKYGIPDDPVDDGVAMSEYFVETLIADDDDANLGNGTPHFSQIVAAFNAHGIGTGYFIHFAHTPLADQPANAPYPVVVNVSYSGAIGALDASSVTLHWSNGGDWQAVSMTATGNPDEFGASIPGQPAGIVHYWFSASDGYGAGSTDPAVAPDRGVYTFLAGPASTVFQQTMETDPGWTVGAAGDNAMTGVWVRVDPNGTEVNSQPCAPEDDHTPGAGTMCWVTGNGAPGENAGVSDVDGGKTTLTTNTFDAASGGRYPVIEYWRWYTNDLGSDPGNDWWRTYISNDNGATWKVVENTEESNASWQRVLFFVDDYLTPTATMKLKFVAQDSAAGSVVEAGIDDFRLLHYPSNVAVDAGAATPVLALSAPWPNPAARRTTLRFSLPARGRATLRVYDVSGRAVRTLADGSFDPGPHAVDWNAADDAGRRVMPGPYFVRLEGAGRDAELVRKVTIVR